MVTRQELLLAGVSARQIERRVEKGLLIPEYRGVYRVGHTAPSTEARYLAAVRACGEGAVLAGLAAAHLQGLLRNRPAPAPEVLTPTERRIEGIGTRRRRRIHPLDVATVKGIPVLTVPATLVDIAARLSGGDLARACHEAGVRYRTPPSHVQAVIARHPRAQGAAKLRAIMTGATKVTQSALEREFLRLLRAASLPLPETNRPAGTKRVDCRWSKRKPPLTVELDSYRFHNSRHAWEQDRVREREPRKRDDDFRRFTHADVFGDPGPMLRELGVALRG